MFRNVRILFAVLAVVTLLGQSLDLAHGQRGRPGGANPAANPIAEKFDKTVHSIPMRDGVKLHTIVYTPKNLTDEKLPVLMQRTCYSIGPYEEGAYKRSLGPSPLLQDAGYIFVYQDVRGCYMSEGTFVNMTPHVPDKKSKNDIDESTDTYDTLEYLSKNLKNYNQRAGIFGISYPGFYSAASMINAHPTLKASSPQAPIADWWYDDFHHHGALFLPHSFNFLSSFGQERPEPTTGRAPRFLNHGTPDGYQFFLDLGPVSNADTKYLKGRIKFWNELMEHHSYDEFWQKRNILPHLNNVAPAVMTVGGWFDAEDLYGPLSIYQSVEKKNPNVTNTLVMGPWAHGGWSRGNGDSLGNVHFEQNTSRFYGKYIEAPFFNHHLKGAPNPNHPEAFAFATGANDWHTFDTWPPKETEQRKLYFHKGGKLSFAPPEGRRGAGGGEEGPPSDRPRPSSMRFEEYVSDPAKPVPFTETVSTGMPRPYMTDDQRFAARRPDVLTFTTDVLEEDVTLAGPLMANLRVSTSGTASDWIVKLVDIYPPDAPNHPYMEPNRKMGNYHMMVRSEVIRGRFRESPSEPKPFVPNRPTLVPLKLQDTFHTFKKGHRIQFQVQSTWFPLVDRNPQTYLENPYKATEEDFIKATQRVYVGRRNGTYVEVGVLPNDKVTASRLEVEEHGKDDYTPPARGRRGGGRGPGRGN
ncbi:MAG: CocE/NonD family hydrolase [Pirellulaceae bacterium]|nr:CocE/NonD family hydrolase [Pirellulaceae bacterium]